MANPCCCVSPPAVVCLMVVSTLTGSRMGHREAIGSGGWVVGLNHCQHMMLPCWQDPHAARCAGEGTSDNCGF